jgi:hypothetical protein
LFLPGFDSRTVQPVASRYIDCAIRFSIIIIIIIIIIVIIIIIIIIIITIIINRTCILIDVAISGDRNVIRKNREVSKIQRPYNRNTTPVECKNKGDSSNNRRDWDHFKVI